MYSLFFMVSFYLAGGRLCFLSQKNYLVPQCIYVWKKSYLKRILKCEFRSKVMSEANVVLIGKKPTMNYVLACITFFHGGAKEVSIKARGKAISRAIDVSEVVRRKFLPGVKVKAIAIGTDQVQPQNEGAQFSNVSTIEITLRR